MQLRTQLSKLQQQLHQQYKQFQLQFEKQWNSVLACSRDEVRKAESVTRTWQGQVMDKLTEHTQLTHAIQRQMGRIEAQLVVDGNRDRAAATRKTKVEAAKEEAASAMSGDDLELKLNAMCTWQNDRFEEILQHCKNNEDHVMQFQAIMTEHVSSIPNSSRANGASYRSNFHLQFSTDDLANYTGSSNQALLVSDVEGYSLVRGWLPTCSTRKTKIDRWTAQNGPVQDCLRLLELFSLGLVFFNIIFMGINVDVQMRLAKGREENPSVLAYIDIAFMLAFVAECLIRIVIRKGSFFRSCFNIIDFVVVLLHVIEVISQSLVSLSFLRFVRNFRILRALRLVRYIDRSRQLRLLLSCLSSIKWPLFWLMVVIMSCLFLCALVITQLAQNVVTQLDQGNRRDLFFHYYGSIVDTMWTLFMATNGAVPWTAIWQPFEEESPYFRIALGLCVSVFTLCVYKIATAIYVDAVVRFAGLERDCHFGELIAHKDSSLQVIRRVLEPCTKEGCISRKQMKKLMTEDAEAIEALEKLDVDEQVLDGVMKLLDDGETGAVRLDELLLAITQLHAPANLVATMMYNSKQVAVRFRHLQQQLHDHFTQLSAMMSTSHHVTSARCI